LGDDRNAFLGKELLHNRLSVAWCIIAPSHLSLVVQQFLAEKSIPVITQPPYCLDLPLSDFWLLPTIKMGLKETRFTTMEDNRMRQPNSRRFQKKPCASASNNGIIDGAKCVRAQGSYYKAD